MLASAISIAAVSALLPAAFASPTLAARACDGGAHVQGKPTSIEGINWPWGGPGEWRVNTALAGSQLYSEFGMRSSAGEWFVEPSTQDPSKYIIRSTAVNDLVISVSGTGGAPQLSTFDAADATQRFEINCDLCSRPGTAQPHAFTCSFKTSSNECITSLLPGSAMGTRPCTSDWWWDQQFDFLIQ
ncbi:hypothetical protein BDV98DRAFT_569715 [Pterulicium gracile]|uniref:Ricin B lectin domain-containing protein n=1 Tax=Pterulicium gracile TaxID=1884261 RepID=A0A5C3QGZ2_9AGAR|nr:hypothetical protein BDV98DRAFT_569715 [Pterula gracilis]